MWGFGHGLVVGRFAPFHVGHGRLITTAVESCERVTVLVVSRDDDVIPQSVRVGWVRELHPDVHVVPVRGQVTPERAAGDRRDRPVGHFLDQVLDHVDRPVDALFGGPGHGPPLAELLGAVWRPVDEGRFVHDVSGRQVRAAPDRFWSMLPAPVRAWYTQRIVVVGRDDGRSPELARALATRLGTDVAGCSRREFTQSRPPDAAPPPQSSALAEVFARQDELTRSAAAAAPNHWLVCESDELVTRAWARHRHGVPVVPQQRASVLEMASPARLYVLDPDPDPDSDPEPGSSSGSESEVVRETVRMHDVVRADLVRRRLPWIEVYGELDERVAQVMHHLPETRVQPLLDFR